MPQLNKNATIKWSTESKGVRRSKSRRVSKSRRSSADPTEGLQVGNPNAAAIDIGCSEHWVAVPAGRTERPTQRFGCCTAELNRLADWLKECGVDTVVMEATGNYWVVLYDILEERQLNPVVASLPHPANVDAVAFSPDGRTVSTGSWDGTAKVWDVSKWVTPPRASGTP